VGFLIGWSFFGDKDSVCFDDPVPMGDTHEMDFQNAIFDEVKIDSKNTLQPNQEKQKWGVQTIFDWKCDSLDAGNITLAGMPIEFLRIKKKKSTDFQWHTYKDLEFISTQNEYNWSDYFIESLEDYDYALVPVGANNVEGDYAIQSVSTDYENIFVLGAGDIQYKFKMNMTLDAIEHVTEEEYVTTLGSKYPYVEKNGTINYRKGHLKLLVITDSTIYGDNGIDRKAEKQLRDDLYNFLTDGLPKVFKESEGTYMLVHIKGDTVKFSPDNEVNRSLQNVEFDFTEIGDAEDMNTLYNDGLIEVNL